MAFLINKFSNAVTNATGSIVGRENLAKLSNSINQSLFIKSNYRKHIRSGNVVQLISRNSNQSLQICQNLNAGVLVLFGNGQIGNDHLNAHFHLYVNPKNRHISLRNFNNYITFESNSTLTVTSENELFNVKKKKKHANQFVKTELRLHELFGSDEHFALESVFCPGNYLCVSSDGHIATTKNKTSQEAHFKLYLIKNFYEGDNIDNSPAPYEQPAGAENVSVGDQAQASSSLTFEMDEPQPDLSTDSPPDYSSLYPKLPTN